MTGSETRCIARLEPLQKRLKKFQQKPHMLPATFELSEIVEELIIILDDLLNNAKESS